MKKLYLGGLLRAYFDDVPWGKGKDYDLSSEHASMIRQLVRDKSGGTLDGDILKESLAKNIKCMSFVHWFVTQLPKEHKRYVLNHRLFDPNFYRLLVDLYGEYIDVDFDTFEVHDAK